MKRLLFSQSEKRHKRCFKEFAWKDSTAASKSDQVGKVSYDTKADEYVDSNGNVRKSTNGY